jgi:hypothetical protein
VTRGGGKVSKSQKVQMLGVHGERANMAKTLNYGALAREQMSEIETMQ